MDDNGTDNLAGKRFLVVGGGSGIAARIAGDAVRAGALVTLAGRDRRRLAVDGVDTAEVDLTDEASIAALAGSVGRVDHVVVTASAPANGPVAELGRDAVHRAFDVKVIGPLLLLKHLDLAEHASVLLFSGVVAWRPAPGRAVMAVTNAAVASLAEALAVELAPVRVNALSPGIVDSGAWDGRADKAEFLAGVAEANPAGRFGTTSDISAAALATLTNPFVTGTTLHVDGGARLV